MYLFTNSCSKYTISTQTLGTITCANPRIHLPSLHRMITVQVSVYNRTEVHWIELYRSLNNSPAIMLCNGYNDISSTGRLSKRKEADIWLVVSAWKGKGTCKWNNRPSCFTENQLRLSFLNCTRNIFHLRRLKNQFWFVHLN